MTLLISHSSYAFDLNDFVSKAKEKVNELLGKEEKVEVKETILLPKIPKVIKDAKSIDVYDKSGSIHTQGAKFDNLPMLEKRRYRIAFLEDLYVSVYGAEANKDELASTLNVLEKGGSREGVYRSLVLSSEYSQLEGYQEIPSEKLITFVTALAGKFMDKKFDKDIMKQLNLYGIKRVMTEKMLEVIDAFPSDGKDLRSWYAVLSSDLAREFPQVWTGQIRGVTAREPHYKWAGSIPLQHLKSEVIIKLHKAMNQLQK